MPETWEFDLFNGLTGVAIYALARLPHRHARHLTRGIIDRLLSESLKDGRGTTWYRPVDFIPDDSLYLFPDGHYCLGLGHGTAGVVAMIAQAHLRDACDGAGVELLEQASRWLLSWRSGDGLPRFPAFVDRAGQEIRLHGITPYGGATPLCWSNTDLGIACALFGAGLALGQSEWKAEALDIAVNAARAATNGEPERVGFMTGHAGVSHIMNRLWHASGDTRCRELAQEAMLRVLDGRRPGAGLAGYPQAIDAMTFSLLVMCDLIAKIIEGEWEHWDVWCNMDLARRGVTIDGAVRESARAALAANRDMLEAIVFRPTELLEELDSEARRLVEDYFAHNAAVAEALNRAVRSGRLLYGVRKILPFYIIFHWNRLGLHRDKQLTLTLLMRGLLDPKAEPR